MKENYDIVIIGAGPAGLTSAIYGLRGGKTVCLIDKQSYGGQIMSTPEVENYPAFSKITGFELANNMYTQAVELGAVVKSGIVNKIEKTDEAFDKDGKGFLYRVATEGGEEFFAKTVVVATGAKNRPLGLPEEEFYQGRGISYCATCDGAFFRNRVVAVLGGGNTALEDALVMSEMAKEVYLIHRRDKFRGEATLVNRIKERENVHIILDSVPTKVLGEKLVEGIEIKNLISGQIQEISVNGVFVAYGQMPDNKDFADLIDLDKAGYVASDENCNTKAEGVFVAGDCRTKKIRQIVTATSDGATAALNAIEYINSFSI